MIGNIQIIISTIAVIVGFFGFILGIRGFGRRRFFNIFSDSVLHKNKSRIRNKSKFGKDSTDESFIAKKQRFLKYVPHNFSLVTMNNVNQNISFGEFAKQIKDNNLTFIVGSSGIGKSIIMQRLAFTFRRKFHKKISHKNLDDYDILFYRVTGAVKLSAMLDNIATELIRSCKRLSIYIDGLDELNELNSQSGEEVLTDLINGLIEKQILNKCKRVIVSLRPEIMKNGFSNFRTDVADAEVWTVGKFTPYQAAKMYNTESKLAKEPRNIRKQNKQQILSLTKDSRYSVFCYPFILTWATDIIPAFTVEELHKISWYDALTKIIENDIKREYKIYVNMNNKILLDEKSEPDYTEDCLSFIRLIAEYMALNETTRVPRSKIIEYGKAQSRDDNASVAESILTSRRLLNYIEWSEHENDMTETYYEFIHNMVYWRILADVLKNPDFDNETRKRILRRERTKDSPFIEMYYTGIYNAYKNSIKAAGKNDFMRDIENGTLRFVRTNGLKLHELMQLIGGIEKVFIHGYLSNAIFLDERRLCDYTDNGILDLSDLTYGNNLPLPLGDLSVLDEFDKNSIREIRLARNELSDISALSEFAHLDVLDISRNPLNCTATIAKQLPNTVIDVAIIDVFKQDHIPDKNIKHVKKWRVRLPSGITPLYKDIWAAKKQKINIELAEVSDFEQNWIKLGKQNDIAEYVYKLNGEIYFAGKYSRERFNKFHFISSAYEDSLLGLNDVYADYVQTKETFLRFYNGEKFFEYSYNPMNKQTFDYFRYRIYNMQISTFALLIPEAMHYLGILALQWEYFYQSKSNAVIPYDNDDLMDKILFKSQFMGLIRFSILMKLFNDENKHKWKSMIDDNVYNEISLLTRNAMDRPIFGQVNISNDDIAKIHNDVGDIFDDIEKNFLKLSTKFANRTEVKNNELSFTYFQIAADNGYIYGQLETARCYEYGRGTRKDIEKARFYYEQAAKQGCESATVALERLNDNA